MSQSGNPVNWFEIPVTDLDRAKAFYEQVVGTNLDVFDRGAVRMAWFPRPENAVGSSGGLVQAPGRTVEDRTVCFSVPCHHDRRRKAWRQSRHAKDSRRGAWGDRAL